MGVHRDARTGALIFQLAARQRAVIFHRRGVEQNFAAGFIRMPARDQLLDERRHVGLAVGTRQYEICRARLMRRSKTSECGDIGVKLVRGFFSDLPNGVVQRHAGEIARRAVVDLVIDVGDVAHVSDVALAIEMPQQPKQHIEHDDGARVANMREVIDRRPAHIHAHVILFERRENALLFRQRIVELQLHRRRTLKALRPGRPMISVEKRRLQPANQLANNLAANAENGERTVHRRHNDPATGEPSRPQGRRWLIIFNGSGVSKVHRPHHAGAPCEFCPHFPSARCSVRPPLWPTAASSSSPISRTDTASINALRAATNAEPPQRGLIASRVNSPKPPRFAGWTPTKSQARYQNPGPPPATAATAANMSQSPANADSANFHGSTAISPPRFGRDLAPGSS